MATQTPEKVKAKEEVASRPGLLVPHRDFPFSLGWIRDEFDRMLDRYYRHWPTATTGNGWRWGVDVEDTDEALLVRAEAPGFEANDFDIRIADNRLVLKASKKTETKEKDGKLSEYHEQECYESISLPSGIDRDKVEAQYRNGILTVKMPKTAEGKAKRVPVKA